MGLGFGSVRNTVKSNQSSNSSNKPFMLFGNNKANETVKPVEEKKANETAVVDENS